MATDWKKADLTYLKRYAKAKGLDELARHFGRSAAAVSAKLGELGLSIKGGPGSGDATVGLFEKALREFHKKDWKEAAKLFQEVGQRADQSDLARTVGVYLELCRSRLAPAVEERPDPYLRAVVEKNNGSFDVAMALCSEGGRRSKDERFAYLAASVHALAGQLDEAMSQLRVAIELNSKNRIHAFHDPDFAPLRGQRGFSELFEANG